ncbi:GerMN domain-containing protein [Mangrovihabitans endophyticus]|uniref:GerMN domain-containing protein n=1 Tax=Mangrovihabitans endophyticus TaxID=1751298 RepID=A0A8J3C892_9ACTN|nr:hypothetical protein GCM10012284_64930 [Mangrovihabitans endophyticus]
MVAVALAGALGGGCGVPLDDEPRDMPGAGLRRSGAPAQDEAGRSVERLCWVRDGHLVRVQRRVPVPPTPTGLLNDLLAGPTADESANGLTSALTTMAGASLTLTGGRAVVEVGDTSNQGVRSDEVFAYGQMVCTLGASLDVGTVSFTSEGQPLSVPRADGSLSDAPLTIVDYSELLRE